MLGIFAKKRIAGQDHFDIRQKVAMSYLSRFQSFNIYLTVEVASAMDAAPLFVWPTQNGDAVRSRGAEAVVSLY